MHAGVRSIDLNADLGERPGPGGRADDEWLLEIVSSANVACGAHAGDSELMRATCAAARRRGVRIGAHVGYPDREGFGRRELRLTGEQIHASVLAQLRALRAAAAEATLTHLKPHGALYHRAAREPAAAQAILAAMLEAGPPLALLGQADSAFAAVAAEHGIPFMREGFADRAYGADGLLIARGPPGGGTLDVPSAVAQALSLVLEQRVQTIDGSWIAAPVDSICVHGDSPGALAIAAAIRDELLAAGVQIRGG